MNSTSDKKNVTNTDSHHDEVMTIAVESKSPKQLANIYRAHSTNPETVLALSRNSYTPDNILEIIIVTQVPTGGEDREVIDKLSKIRVSALKTLRAKDKSKPLLRK
jgi:hypothetical protein